MADATVSRYPFSLGDRDTYTGWCAPTYGTAENVDAVILHQGEVVPQALSAIGMYAKYPHTIYIPDVIRKDDLIRDANRDYYRIDSAKLRWWLNKFDGYECRATKVKQENYAARPATSGTWHMDSDSVVTDVRYRMKSWLDGNMSAIYEDNGYTSASVVTMMAEPDYDLWREFSGEGTDVIIYVEQASCKARKNCDFLGSSTYGFDESATLNICAVDKNTVTAARIVEAAEQAVREVITNHPTGSIRSLESIDSESVDLGGMTMRTRKLKVGYIRANDDYIATYPRLTWGASASSDGIYCFPNCISIEYPDEIPAVELRPIRSLGGRRQRMADSSLTVRLRCDLTVERTSYTWKRPQTTTPKTDTVKWQIILDMKHNAVYQTDEPYQTLTLGSAGPSFAVTLDNWRVIDEFGMEVLEATFREYNSSSASVAYRTRWGLS